MKCKGMLEVRTVVSPYLVIAFLLGSPGEAAAEHELSPQHLRLATFNVSLYGEQPGEVAQRLAGGNDPQARALAEIIQRVRPDVLLLNEVDYTPDELLARTFHDKYLVVGQNFSNSPDGAAEPVAYPHRFSAPSNTGVHSGRDLDHNGVIDSRPGSRDYGGDSWGYGIYPGQYAMVVMSRYPIDVNGVRTFQKFLWQDMPSAKVPNEVDSPASWYTPHTLEHFRLSSKNHIDVPILIDGRPNTSQRVHLLASHPTPPGFDGPEDRNGLRNEAEIQFWVDYVDPEVNYHHDDDGKRGGLMSGELFVIAGDLNADPFDGSDSPAIKQLLNSPRVAQSDPPASRGGEEQAAKQAGVNQKHHGPAQHDTLDAADREEKGDPGNLRVDYVIPSQGIRVVDSGVFWPKSSDPLSKLTGEYPFPSSDHRLVWVDVELKP